MLLFAVAVEDGGPFVDGAVPDGTFCRFPATENRSYRDFVRAVLTAIMPEVLTTLSSEA
ncbi:MAG: hypothetical protein OXH09_04915 [Gammaproteobacteria bacterium]|nr:hypothetical protein [Gammaproteobacteria bacterium]